MRWLDVAGPPGSGKSSLCYPIWGDRSVGWDGQLPAAYWRPFIDEITSLCNLVSDHPSIEAVIRMNDRSAKKMSTVERMSESICAAGQTPDQTWGKVHSNSIFVQTGLVQRILGFGWRLNEMGRDINLIRPALWRMPVSVGVVFLEADLETLLARNRNRETNPATAHENRSAQVPHMLACIPLAKEVLKQRGIPILELDVQNQSIDAARDELLDFARFHAPFAASAGRGCEGSVLPITPPWWRS